MKIFEEKNKESKGLLVHLSACQLDSENLEIFLRSPIGATSVRAWQPQPGKSPSLNFGKDSKNGASGGGVQPFFVRV